MVLVKWKRIVYDHCLFIQYESRLMIGRIAGTLIEKNPPQLLIDCQGVGYEVDVPMSTFYNLPPLGEKVEGAT